MNLDFQEHITTFKHTFTQYCEVTPARVKGLVLKFPHFSNIKGPSVLNSTWQACDDVNRQILEYKNMHLKDAIRKSACFTCNVGQYNIVHHHNCMTLFDQMCQSNTTSYQCLANLIYRLNKKILTWKHPVGAWIVLVPSQVI